MLLIKHYHLPANMEVTQQKFAFPEKNGIPLYYVSASNGMNVVKVRPKWNFDEVETGKTMWRNFFFFFFLITAFQGCS